MTKLYDLKKGDKIIAETSDGGTEITFDHVDGMYSYCKTNKDNVIHLSAVTPLKKVADGIYKLDIKEDENNQDSV